MGDQQFESSNINTLWLQNAFENLKNLEIMERNAREGCQSMLDYLQIPAQQKKVIIADTMYKNLSFMITEIDLLLTDLSPIIDDKIVSNYKEQIKKLIRIKDNRRLFVKESYSASSNKIMSSSNTKMFYDVLDIVSVMKYNLIKELSPILFVKEGIDLNTGW